MLFNKSFAAITPAGTVITTQMVTINYDVFEVTQDAVVTGQIQPIYGLDITPTSFSTNLVTTSNQVVVSMNVRNLGNSDQIVSINSLLSSNNWSVTAYLDSNSDGIWQPLIETTSYLSTFNVPIQSSVNILLVLSAVNLNSTVNQTTQFNVPSDGGAYTGFNAMSYGGVDQKIYVADVTLNVVFNANNFAGIATANGIDTHDGSVTLSWNDPGNFPGTIYQVTHIVGGVPTVIYSGPLLQFHIPSLPDRTTQDFLIQASYSGVTTDYSVTMSVYMPDATIDLPPANPSGNFAMTPAGLMTYSEGPTTQVSVSIDAVALGLDLNADDFSSIVVTRDASGSFYISVPSTSALAVAVNGMAASGNTVNVPITVRGGGPLITLDTGSGPYTINQYNQVLDKDTNPPDYRGRLAAFSFDQALNTVYFEVTHFSTYGFANIVTINMSPVDVTINMGATTNITVNVLDDSLSPPVQGAPVTINIISGTGSFVGSTTGTTDVNGDVAFTFLAGAVPGNVVIKADAGFVTSTQSVTVHVLQPDIVYVSVTGNNSNPGTLAAPYATLTYAYSQVATGGIVYMLPGTHTINSTITLAKDLTIAGYSTSLNTMITTNATRHFIVTNNNTYNLSITLNNLTFTGGVQNTNFDYGAFLFVEADSPQITVNILSSRVSGNRVLIGPTSLARGGAIAASGINPHIIIRDSIFNNNRAARGGVFQSGTIQIYNSQLVSNSATGASAGLGGVCSDSDIYLENSVIANNNAQNSGSIGFGCDVTANNSVLYSNTTSALNVLFGVQSGGSGYFQHSIVQEPILIAAAQPNVRIFNSFVYNNTTSANADVSGNYHYEQRFIQFTNPSANNFNLSGASHIIDLGTANITVANDTYGIARPVFLRQDMGAFEFQGLTVINMEPILYQTAVPATTNITFNVVSALSTVITSSITATINGVDVANGSFTFTPTANGVQAFYDSPIDFPGLTQISVTINAQDTSGNVLQKIYVFTTGTAPVAGPIAFNISHGPTISYTTIIQAAAEASANDTILVTPGVHIEVGTITVNVSLNISSISGVSTNTAISGADLHQVLVITNNAVVSISQLTIQNGYLLSSNGDSTKFGGAGIFLASGSLALTQIRGVSNNMGDGAGGFLFAANGTTLNINNSYIADNHSGTAATTEGLGGALFSFANATISNTYFIGNTSTRNPNAISAPIVLSFGNTQNITQVTFNNNVVSSNYAKASAAVYVGAAEFNGLNPVQYINAYLSGNTFANNGGGLGAAVHSNYASLNLNRNLFSNNSSVQFGGAVALLQNTVATLNNNLFFNNTAAVGGALIANLSRVYSEFNTYYGNNATSSYAGVLVSTATMNIVNDIYFNNLSSDNFQVSFVANSAGNISYTDISSGNAAVSGNNFEAGVGNVTANPVFVNAPAGNLQLGASSPLSVREGATNNVLTTIDYLGVTRTNPYSMGAFEFDGLIPIAFNQTKGMLPYNTIIEAVEAASANDVIVITANTITQPTYIEASTITINLNLTITSLSGVSTSVLIDGNNDHRIFIVTDNAQVTISYLTIQNGFVSADIGAGINLVNGILYLNNIIASGNRALNGVGLGGFLAVGTQGNAEVTQSLFRGNIASNGGGGIFGSGSNLSVSYSTFYGNSAGYGGGAVAFSWSIGDPARITFNNNIVSGNFAGSFGGALFLGKDTGSGDYNEFQALVQNNLFIANSSAGGGAIIGYFGTKTLLNNIFVSNNASFTGGAMVLVASANAQFNTYYGNAATVQGGAVQLVNGVLMSNEIFANNIAPTASQIYITGTSTLNYSIVPLGTTADVSTYLFFSQPGNITGNPLFVDAANRNFNLQLGSPAIGAATSNVLVTTDYTGAARTLPYEMGAFEFINTSPNIAFNISHGPTINYTTIMQAVAEASPNDTILVTSGVHVEVDQVTINVSLNITSLSGVSTNTVISGGGTHRIFLVTNNAVVTISAMTLQSGYNNESSDINGGGALRVAAGSILNLNQIIASGNTAINLVTANYGYGGFLHGNLGSTVNISNSYFSNNFSEGYGGAITFFGYSSIQNSIFINNVSSANIPADDKGFGGAVAGLGPIQFINNIVSGNRSHFGGGGIVVQSTTPAIVQNNIFSVNDSKYGGAIYNAGLAAISSNNFTNNTAQTGGAYIAFGGSVTFNRNLFTNNSAIGSGGAIIVLNGLADIFNNIFVSNNAITVGAVGGSASTVNSQFNTYYGNSATQTGGAFGGFGASHITIFNDIYYGNTAVTGNHIAMDVLAAVTINNTLLQNDTPTVDIAGFDNFISQPGNVTGNPLFTNALTGDFTLQTISPASVRNGGTSNVLVTTDFNNTARTIPYSMGAFELDSTPNFVTQSIHLEPGYNLISIYVSVNMTADDLLVTFNAKGASVNAMLDYDSAFSSFSQYLLDYPFLGGNFTIVPVAKGFFIYSNTSVTINLVGAPITSVAVPLLGNAYSIIGYPKAGFTASSMINAINTQVGPATTLNGTLRYDTPGSFYEQYLPDYPFLGGDFNVNMNGGYFIYTSGPSVTYNITLP